MRLTFLKGVTLAFLCCLTLRLIADSDAQPPRKDAGGAAVTRATDADTMRIEGEKRFRANCARCHAAPQKFPPRAMATIVRHMRVRATITDQDMRFILFYMTQ